MEYWVIFKSIFTLGELYTDLVLGAGVYTPLILNLV